MAKQIVKFSPLHEQIVLGSMLRDPTLRVELVKRLDPAMFYAPNHRIIFSALVELTEKGLDYTPGTLKSFLPSYGDWGGSEYLDKLVEMESPENIEYHIERAKWDRSRNLILGHDINELEVVLRDPRSSPEEAAEILKEIQGYISEIDEGSAFIHGPGMAARYEAKLHARESGHHIRTSGYLALDKKLTNPFGPGLISVLAALPSTGKTSLALNMAMRQSKRWKVGYLAWEGDHFSATDTISSCALGIPLLNIIKFPGRRTHAQREAMSEFIDNLYDERAMLSFLKRPPKEILKKRSPWEVNDAVIDYFEAQVAKWGRDIIYWDLFEKTLADTKPHAITWAVNRIQQIAKDYNVHIVLLHQINLKEAEKRHSKIPTRGLVKGAGIYIEAPDFVFGLHREGVYNPRITDDELEVYVLKQRHGVWPFKIVFDWAGEYCRVSGGKERQITVEDDFDEDGV